MIIIINGPLGVGKTETSWQLIEHFDKAIMLDADYIVAAHPFEIYNDARIDYLYETLAHNVAWHVAHGYHNFVVNYVFEKPESLAKLRHLLSVYDDVTYAFRLTCAPDEIERRIRARSTDPDGLRWESIYEQVAVGYSEKRSDYQFTDVLPLPGLDYYRLRSVDFDGSEDFSPTVAVRYGSDPAQAVMYPSPASSSVSFQLEADAREKAAFAFLFDPLGRLARSVRLPEPGGPDTPIPLDDLVAGLYFVEFRSEEGVRLATGKFLKRGN